MKQAVAYLEPYMEEERRQSGSSENGRIVMATVKGDVHDIGKNTVTVVLRCNDYEVIDPGGSWSRPSASSRRPASTAPPPLASAASSPPPWTRWSTWPRKWSARTSTCPCSSAAPPRAGATLYVSDASRAPAVLGRLGRPDAARDLIAATRQEQERLRDQYRGDRAADLVPFGEARARAPHLSRDEEVVPAPSFTGLRQVDDYAVADLVEYTDWSPFLPVWELRGGYPRILDDATVGVQACELFDDTRRMLDRIVEEQWLRAAAVYGLFPAARDGEDIVIFADAERWLAPNLGYRRG